MASRSLIVLAFLLCATSHVRAQVVTLEQVLDCVARHPDAIASALRVAAAEGARTSAEGAFDLSVHARGTVTPAGYYNYGTADAQLVQPTALWGTTLYTGWRFGRGWDGGIPSYYGHRETLSAGEARVGATIPLWQDGPIDSRRASLRRAEAGVTVAEHELQARVLRLRQAASETYARWVAAAQKQKIVDALMHIAEERDAQVRARVSAGAIAEIEVFENQRVILERKVALVSARRATERAAIALSIYLRDGDGAPVVPTAERVPDQLHADAWPQIAEDERSAIALAYRQRPELARLQPAIERARISRDLADNQTAPRLDWTVEGSMDLGSASQATRDRLAPGVVETSVLLSLPLQRRDARGRSETAIAELRQLEAERELLRNTIAIEVRDALSAHRNAEQGVALALESARMAEKVRDAERARFDNGLSTLLMVNLREDAAARARGDVIEAQAALFVARTQLSAALGSPLR